VIGNRRPSRHAQALTGLGAAVTLLTAAASPAFAYVDPGTGAMLLQMGAAAFAAALFYFRSALGRIAAWFSGSRTKTSKQSD
jgi:hypothetical protein